MASPNLSELIATTLRDRSKKFADNVSKGNVILMKLKEKGGWESAEGRSIVQEVEYAEGNFQWYSGYEAFNVAPPDVLSAAEFNWKQAVGTVTASGLETEVQNKGKAAVIPLLKSRIRNCEHTMKNNVTIGMYSDGTGSSGKQIGGLQHLVADDPTSGTVGGIDRGVATNAFWRNQVYDNSTDGGAATTAANIQAYMNATFLRCTRGNDRPNLIVTGTTYYALFWASLQAIQRVTDEKTATAGFQNLAFAGNVPVCFEDSTGIPNQRMYFLNTDYLHFRYAEGRLFEPAKEMKPVNQDAEIHAIYFAGNLTASNCALQGVMKE